MLTQGGIAPVLVCYYVLLKVVAKVGCLRIKNIKGYFIIFSSFIQYIDICEIKYVITQPH